MTSNDKQLTVPIQAKYAMNIKEASEYFGIGEKKLRQIITENLDMGFTIQNGNKYIIKRRLFEQYLDARSSI